MSAPTTRVRLAPEQRRAALLVVAREVLRDVGYERFVITEVAQRAGVSEALVYKYFPTKRELLTRVAEAWFGELLGAGPGIAEQADVHGRLLYLVRYSLQVVHEEPALSRFILTDLRSDPAYRSSELYALNRRFTGFVGEVLRDAIASGEYRDDVDVRLLRDMIFGAVEHRTWAFLRDEGEFDLDSSAEGIARVIHRGMSAA
jgi:TetR/AcrR family transcriptional regulator, fatty acid metabolism regulator protein